MLNSGWSYADIVIENHIMPYDNRGKPMPDYSLITYPDGGLRTNIIDLSYYLMTVIKGYHQESEMLADSSWRELFRPQFEGKEIQNTDPTEPESGIFWFHRKGGIIGHSGSDPGISSLMYFNPKTRIGKIFMTNSELNKNNVEDFKKIWTKLDDLVK
jgi:CubicO group peptidase (beta-lactamase class C family)